MRITSDLYNEILKCMPISCVDLLIVNNAGDILLVKRQNEPAKDLWWFPGGRVYYKETRRDAAIRKLKEECNLAATEIRELGTFDVILENNMTHSAVHGITTLFFMKVDRDDAVKLDYQSRDADWRTRNEWCKEKLDPFVKEGLSL